MVGENAGAEVDQDTLVIALVPNGPGTGDMMVGAVQEQLEWAAGKTADWASTDKGPGKRSSLKCLGICLGLIWESRQDGVERVLAPCGDS